jgi:hypothetical protein
VVRDEGEPVEFGAGWPVIHELMRRLFLTPESGYDQFWTLLAHLKLSLASLRQCLRDDRNVRPAQAYTPGELHLPLRKREHQSCGHAEARFKQAPPHHT